MPQGHLSHIQGLLRKNYIQVLFKPNANFQGLFNNMLTIRKFCEKKNLLNSKTAFPEFDFFCEFCGKNFRHR